MTKWLALGLDAVAVIIFAAAGRSSHHEGLAGTFQTALPFLLALVIAWIIPAVYRRPFSVLPAGVIVWLMTVFAGQGLRLLLGGTSAFSFLMVTICVLALFLLGWRAISYLVFRLAAKKAS